MNTIIIKKATGKDLDTLLVFEQGVIKQNGLLTAH